MSGTLTYWENHIPKEGELVYIFVVPEKGFPTGSPTGAWKGVLTFVGDIGESYIIPIEEQAECHTVCKAEITDNRAPAEWQYCEPTASYEVYPDAPGMEKMFNKLFAQKGEIKALKREIEGRKKFFGEFVQMMKKGLGAEVDVSK